MRQSHHSFDLLVFRSTNILLLVDLLLVGKKVNKKKVSFTNQENISYQVVQSSSATLSDV